MDSCLRREVLNSLSCDLAGNAVFLCERLFAEKPTEENALLLARCYCRNRQEYRAYHVLKDGGPLKVLSPECRLLLAQCCIKLGHLPEAEEVLLKKYRSSREAPLGPVENYLVGRIHRLTSRPESAKEYCARALELDPFLWVAFEELCRLGASGETSKIVQNMACIAEIENEVQSLHINTPASAMETPTPQNHIGSPLMNAPNRISEGTPGFQNFANDQDRYDGSPRTPTSMTSPAPRCFQHMEHSIGMDSSMEMQVLHVPPTNKKKNTPVDSDVPIRRSARIAALSSRKGRASSTRRQSEATAPPSSNRSMSGQPRNHRYGGSVPEREHDSSAKSRMMDDGTKAALRLLTFLGEGYRLLSMYRCKDAIQVFTSRLPTNQYCTGWVLCQVAKAHAESVDYHSAQKSFENARLVDPQRLEDMDVYSTVLWQLGELDKLSHLADAAVSLERLAPETWCIVGNVHSKNTDPDSAIKAFQRAMQLDPDRPYTYTLCGHEYFALEDFERAQQCFRKAINKDGRHYKAWYGAGLVHYRQEKYESAQAQFRRAISINNASSVLKCQLGMTLAKLSKNDGALLQLQQAINSDRKNIIAWLEKAKVLQNMERHQEALEVLQGALVIEHRDPCLHFQTGIAYKNLGKKNEAVKHYFHALDLKPSAADQNFIRTAIEKINVEDDCQDTEL
ncbi:hypothetical protein BSKO_02192 [Bryopsis sp. KO-2023]|nr:hypothetical protein BSKO_02192 [Bryopsis sp. KO-2023]